MRLSVILLSFLTLVAAALLQADAQEPAPLPDESTAAPRTVAQQQETPDPFLQTATEIIRQATAAATLRGTSGVPPTITPSVMATTTGIAPEGTAETVLAAQTVTEEPEEDDPLLLTFVAFGSLLLILVVFGYVVVTASNAPEESRR